MANINIKDAAAASKYTKSTGAGTDLDPFIPEHSVTGIGEVQASPTANTVLDRLKALLTGISLAAGANAIGKLAANSGVDIGDVDVTSIIMPTAASAAQVQGTAAHDSAAANNPLLTGAFAANVEPAAVANADAVHLIADLVGKLIVLPYANPENFISGSTAAIVDTTRTALLAAAGAGVRNYVTHIIVTNSHATVGTFVKIEDGTTTLYQAYAAPAGGGFSISLPVPLKGTANTTINISCVTTGANVIASASGYKGA